MMRKGRRKVYERGEKGGGRGVKEGRGTRRDRRAETKYRAR